MSFHFFLNGDKKERMTTEEIVLNLKNKYQYFMHKLRGSINFLLMHKLRGALNLSNFKNQNLNYKNYVIIKKGILLR